MSGDGLGEQCMVTKVLSSVDNEKKKVVPSLALTRSLDRPEVFLWYVCLKSKQVYCFTFVMIPKSTIKKPVVCVCLCAISSCLCSERVWIRNRILSLHSFRNKHQVSDPFPSPNTHKVLFSHGLQTAPKQAQLHLVPQHDVTTEQFQMLNL